MDFGYNYSYDYDYNVPVYSDSGSEVLSVLIGIYLIILGGALLIMLVGYIFHSIGMYTIGKRMGKAHTWMAFVPFARDYFQGELAGPIRLKNKEIRNPGIWNLVLPIIFSAVTGVLTTVMIVGTVMGDVERGRAGRDPDEPDHVLCGADRIFRLIFGGLHGAEDPDQPSDLRGIYDRQHVSRTRGPVIGHSAV